LQVVRSVWTTLHPSLIAGMVEDVEVGAVVEAVLTVEAAVVDVVEGVAVEALTVVDAVEDVGGVEALPIVEVSETSRARR